MLPELEIQNAQNLINYTLSSSWTRTCFRFSVFLRFYTDQIRVNIALKMSSHKIYRNNFKFQEVTNEMRANTLILLDEDNNEQLPKLVKFLERNNTKIHPSIKSLVMKIELEREKSQNCGNRPLCLKWLEFGQIHDKTLCTNRHILMNVDITNQMPQNGTV